MPRLVSILIPTYEAGRFLRAALTSVVLQTHAEWELIVVEDGSHDETEAILRAFASQYPHRRIIYNNLGSNRGVAAARNRLLELAHGDVLAFLDADDIWDARHLTTLVACLTAGNHALACTPIALWDGDYDRSLGTYAPTVAQIGSPRLELFRTSFIWTSTSVALARTTVEGVGRFDEGFRIGEDRDYWFRAVEGRQTVGCTARPTCRYTKHASSSMTKTLRVAADSVRFYEKHIAAVDIPISLRRRLLAAALVVYGRLLRAAEPGVARELLGRAVRLDPWKARTWLVWIATFLTMGAPRTKDSHAGSTVV